MKDHNELSASVAAWRYLQLCHIVVRVAAALWSTITDCDETYNYWEPTSFLLYGKGFQTWEYSPEYALRSYLYVGAHALAGKSLQLIGVQALFGKIGVFYGIRILLALFCAHCERRFVKAVRFAFNFEVSFYTLAFLTFSTGMFFAGPAYLPSSFAMCFVMLSYAGWMTYRMDECILWMAVTTLVAWPFAALLGVVMGIDTLRKVSTLPAVRTAFKASLLCLVPSMIVDYFFYQKVVVAVANIFLYNSDAHSETGQNLYGTEPPTFFLANLFLNFNVVWLISLAALPLALVQALVKRSSNMREQTRSLFHSQFLKFSVSFYAVVALFSYMPHKEERFLYPAYPLLCFAAAYALTELEGIVTKKLYKKVRDTIPKFLICVVFIATSLSRTLAIINNYGAPLPIYAQLSRHIESHDHPTRGSDDTLHVCVGQEWYRFPSHFFLPDTPNTELSFLKAGFGGQLPRMYESYDSERGLAHSTSVIPPNMNNVNREEPSRYASIDACDYIVEYEPAAFDASRASAFAGDEWQLLFERPFLNAGKTPTVARVLALPLSDDELGRHVDAYRVYQRIKKSVAVSSQNAE